MDDFSKYLKSMLDQLMSSGNVNGGAINFDQNNAGSIMQMFFGGAQGKKEKLAVKKLTEEELEQYQEIMLKKEKLQSQFKRLVSQNKILDAEMDLFWQDMKDSDGVSKTAKLSVDTDSGFLFQEVNIDEENKSD